MQNKIYTLLNEKINIILFTLFLLAIFIAYIYPNLHDYGLYMKQWEILLTGKTLPDYDNAYGITHYLFSSIFYLSDQFPKLVYISFYLFSIKLLLKNNFEVSKKNTITFFLILITNPIFWCFGVFYGSNDLFVASMTLISIYLYDRNSIYSSSVVLFLGITYKFFPILILPFLVINKNKINYKYVFIIIIMISIEYILGYLKWGDTIFNPFLFGGSRGAKMLSIFAFISSSYSPLGFIHIYHLDFLSIYFVAFTWILTFFLYIKYKLDKHIMILLAFSNVLLFYKVGHHQFYLTLMLITIYTIFIHFNKFKMTKTIYIMKLSLILFWSFLFFVTLLYFLTDGYKGNFHLVREIVGLPFFIFHFFMNICWLFFAFKIKNSMPQKNISTD